MSIWKKNRRDMLCIGLFDKDTKKQEIKTEEAMRIINNILLQYVDGATCYLGDGIYKHIDNTIVIEPNIIVLLYDVNKTICNKIINELKKNLNQEAVMQERTSVRLSFK